MGNVPGDLMMLLVDVSVEYRHILVRHEHVCYFDPIAGRPIPLRIEIKQRAMGT